MSFFIDSINKYSAIAFIVLLFSCTSEREKAITEITDQEKLLFTDSTKAMDPDKASKMLKSYADFVQKFPTDSLNPDYLFKAADIAQGLNHEKLALQYYTQIVDSYPDSRKAASALFMKAFVCQNSGVENEAAKKYYSEFIARYPNHPLLASAQAALDQLNSGLSDEELVKMFIEREDSMATGE